jgi:hypothetical protein
MYYLEVAPMAHTEMLVHVAGGAHRADVRYEALKAFAGRLVMRDYEVFANR